MRTLVLDPMTAGLEPILERRKRSGLDRMDEIWEGVLHMVPAPSHAHGSIEAQLMEQLGPSARKAGLELIGQSNLGEGEHNFRVPDCSLHRPGAHGVWHATAALVVEVVSPNDESWEKLPFYAEHGVDEALIVDPEQRSVEWLGLINGRYEPIARSRLIELGADELDDTLDWPDLE
ncbi:MAG TPA: Uma2 family endonuclease [Solirubrobacteraceae bacterium]|nr:Uma2 family endonuclease [Solirubrobacteraceae bacterium]